MQPVTFRYRTRHSRTAWASSAGGASQGTTIRPGPGTSRHCDAVRAVSRPWPPGTRDVTTFDQGVPAAIPPEASPAPGTGGGRRQPARRSRSPRRRSHDGCYHLSSCRNCSRSSRKSGKRRPRPVGGTGSRMHRPLQPPSSSPTAFRPARASGQTCRTRRAPGAPRPSKTISRRSDGRGRPMSAAPGP